VRISNLLRAPVIVIAIAAALLAAPMTGCDVFTVTVELPGFHSGDVDSLWFWRANGTGWERICRFDLSDVFVDAGVEQVRYQQTCLDGRPASAMWQAKVERLPSDPGTVVLQLVYQRSGTPTEYRASAVNVDGESALSSTSLTL
jgi:hypothetical protein